MFDNFDTLPEPPLNNIGSIPLIMRPVVDEPTVCLSAASKSRRLAAVLVVDDDPEPAVEEEEAVDPKPKEKMEVLLSNNPLCFRLKSRVIAADRSRSSHIC